MELELKHLAAYFPYGLKCFYLHQTLERFKIINKVFELGSIDLKDKRYMYWTHDRIFLKNTSLCGKGFSKSDFKPILRPLSDITKEIEVNGEKFIPRMKFIGNPLDYKILNNSYNVIEQLLEWHFDVFGLIENNLAIDINTLK